MSNLERLLNLEREERKDHEKTTMALLEDVKKKWHDRDDKRQQQLRKDLKDANVVVQDMELELNKKESDLVAAHDEIDTLQTVKQSLKAKLKECKSKLEATVANYEAKAELVEKLEAKIATLEVELRSKDADSEKKKRRVSIAISDNRAELEAVREDMERLARQKRTLESELSDLRLTSKLTANRLDTLQKEYDEHLARCDAELVKISSENARMQDKNRDLEKEIALLEAKLKDKSKALLKLEKVQESLEAKIPSKETFDAYANSKVNDLLAEIEELKKDNRLMKVEVRMGERKEKELEGRIAIFRDMYNDVKKKTQKDSTDGKELVEKVAKLEKDVEKEKLEKEELKEKNGSLQSRVDSLRKELNELKSESRSNRELERELERLKEKLSKCEKDTEKSSEYKKNYDLTKNICLELEDQVKQYEVVIEKLEKSQEKLQKSNEELKGKADASAAELIKFKREVNELKSTQAFKETKLKDLEEKNKEIEKFYETEGATWKTRFEESTKVKKEQTVTIVELKDLVLKLESENDKISRHNDELYDQNKKLKEEMTTLITSFHSLKDSHLMLQNTVQELGDKLMARDEEIERRERKIVSLKSDLDRKNIEHQETLNQLKKLTQHLPDSTPSKKKDKYHHAPFML